MTIVAPVVDDPFFVDDFEPAPYEPPVCPECDGTDWEEDWQGRCWRDDGGYDDNFRCAGAWCIHCGHYEATPEPARDDEIPF